MKTLEWWKNPKLYILFHRIINYEIKAGGK